MNKAQIQYEYNSMTTPTIPGWVFIICLFIAFLMWGAPFLGWYSYGSVGFTLLCNFGIFVALLFVSAFLSWLDERQFFNRPEIHSHDDDCVTCGDGTMYGNSYINVPNAYHCRQGTNKPMRYSPI